MHRIARLAIPTIAILVFGLIGGSAASPNTGLTKQDAAKKILSSGASKNMTGPARAFVEATARGDHRLSADANVITQKGNKVNSSKPVGGGSRTEFGSATCAPQPKRNGPAAPLRGDVVADAHSRRRHRSDRREPSRALPMGSRSAPRTHQRVRAGDAARRTLPSSFSLSLPDRATRD